MKKINIETLWEDVRYHRHRIWVNSLGFIPLTIKGLSMWTAVSEKEKISLIGDVSKIFLVIGIILLCVYILLPWTTPLWVWITPLSLSMIGAIICLVWSRILNMHGD
jgi:hypothetical protein